MFEFLSRKLARGRGVRKHVSRRPGFCRRTPQLEALEDRCLLSSVLSQFAVPTAGSSPFGIVTGPDGNLWFTEFKGNNIGEINATTDAVTEYPIPTATSAPLGITSGPDGRLWFTESTGNKIGAIDPSTGVISEYPVTTAGSLPFDITDGPDGNLWFTEGDADQIGMITPAGVVTEYPIPTASSFPAGITLGPDGNLWFTENGANQIGMITTSGTITEYPTPTTGSGPLAIAAGADGYLWFTENNVDQIGAINPSSTANISEYALPSGSDEPFWITSGPDGNLWFTDMNANQINAISPATADITQFSLGGGSSPAGIAAGPDGTVWFADSGASQIGAVYLAPTIAAYPANHVIHAGQTTSLSVVVSGDTEPTVQWKVSTDGGETFEPLSNDSIYDGVNTDTLTIMDAPLTLNGDEYKAVLTNTLKPSAGVATRAGILSVKPPLSLPSAFPSSTAGAAYNETLTVGGGIKPFSTFTVTNFNGGGTGLTAADITTNSSTGTIAVHGTSSAAGAATFTATVTDATGTTLTDNATITINPPPTIGAITVNQWTAGMSGFNGTMTIAGGTGPFVITGYSGLPTGWTPTVHGAVISFTGAPLVAQAYPNGSIAIRDAAGAKVTQDLNITINRRVAIGPLTMTQWTEDTPGYTGSIAVGGGTGTLQIAHSSGLPTGLTAVLTGGTITFTGVPTVTGTFAHAGITLEDAIGTLATKVFTIAIRPKPALGSLTLSQWTAGMAGFSGTMTISGGTGPFIITATTGLPTGLTPVIKGNTISFTGMTTQVETLAPASITIQDAAGATASVTFALTINAAPGIGDLTASQWTVGKAGFTGTMAISGGTGPFHIAAVSGLPTGLTAMLSGSTVSFTSTPQVSGTFSAGSITIRDAAGARITKTFTIIINPRLGIGALTLGQWTINQSGFSGTMSITGGTGSFSITHAGGLPTGVTASVTGRTISLTGVPTVAGTFTCNITVQDAVGTSVTKTFTIIIKPQ